jgi:hypothetical protein
VRRVGRRCCAPIHPDCANRAAGQAGPEHREADNLFGSVVDDVGDANAAWRQDPIRAGLQDGLVFLGVVNARIPAFRLEPGSLVDREPHVVANPRPTRATDSRRRSGFIEAVADVFVEQRPPLARQIGLRERAACQGGRDDQEQQANPPDSTVRVHLYLPAEPH